MSRIEELRKKINIIFTRINEMPPKYSHLIEVSQVCALLAIKRGENAELATMAGLLHDIAVLRSHDAEPYKIHGVTGENHAVISADIAMEMLLEMSLTSMEENEIICEAIKKHADKNNVDTLFDEVLKDADVFAHGLSDISLKNFRGYRWDKVCQELGINNCR